MIILSILCAIAWIISKIWPSVLEPTIDTSKRPKEILFLPVGMSHKPGTEEYNKRFMPKI